MVRPMHYIHGAIALVLAVVAMLHVPHPTPFLWVPYALASALAAVTLFPEISLLLSRLLALSLIHISEPTRLQV